MSRSPIDLANHARQLCEAFGVMLQEDGSLHQDHAVAGTYGEVKSKKIVLRTVHIAPITGEETYFIALHEIGHHVHPLGLRLDVAGSRDPRIKLGEEIAAWEWAQHYALYWNERGDKIRDNALATYHQSVALFDKHGVDMSDPEAVLKSMFEKLLGGAPGGKPAVGVVQRTPEEEQRVQREIVNRRNAPKESMKDFLKRTKR